MPAFNRLCVQTWRATNPGWRVEVVDRERLRQERLVAPGDLPHNFPSLQLSQHKADCAKLALLLRHGGVYMDSSILVWGDLAEVIGWRDVEEGHVDFVGYYLGTTDFVENWFLACRRACPLVREWSRVHLRFWEAGAGGGRDLGDLGAHPFFRGVNLDHIQRSERGYLVQHACYKKLLDSAAGSARGSAWWRRARITNGAKHLFFRQVYARVKLDEWKRCRRIVDVETWMKHLLLLEDDSELVEELERKRVPFLKITGRMGWLQDCRYIDLYVRRNTLRRLFIRALCPGLAPRGA